MNKDAQQCVTVLIERLRGGDASAEAELMGVVYDELRSMAAAKVSGLGPGETLQATALVNEAYMKLASGASSWESRAHFFGAAARAMRNIIVDQVRRKASAKRGGGLRRVELDTRVAAPPSVDPDRLLDLDAAMLRLEKDHPRVAKIVDVRFFVGLSDQETADLLGISVSTVYREWAYAKAWLRRELAGGDEAALGLDDDTE